MDNQFRGNSIRELTTNLEEVKKWIGEAESFIGQRLRQKRYKIWKILEKRVDDLEKQVKEEADAKKADQYDFKEREKELNEHLETMTHVAQKIDDDNKLLQLKN